MNRVLKALLPLAVCALPLAAHADTFNFSASGSGSTGAGAGFNGSGQFTTTKQTDGSYLITGITGSGNDGSKITGLIAPNTFSHTTGSTPAMSNDNLLFPSSVFLVDNDGFSFTDVLGDTSFRVNIFLGDGGSYRAYLVDSDGDTERFKVNFDVSPAAAATPEPSSLLLLGTGVAGIAFFMRRRMGTAASDAA